MNGDEEFKSIFIINFIVMLIVKLIYSVFFIALGFGLIKFRRNIKGWTGNFVWAERYLGNGGTYLVLVLFGMFLIFYGVIYPFGGMELLTK